MISFIDEKDELLAQLLKMTNIWTCKRGFQETDKERVEEEESIVVKVNRDAK